MDVHTALKTTTTKENEKANKQRNKFRSEEKLLAGTVGIQTDIVMLLHLAS